MNRSGMKCVLYPRVSTEMQIDGFSLDGQRTSLNRFANREEMIVVDIYEDAGYKISNNHPYRNNYNDAGKCTNIIRECTTGLRLCNWAQSPIYQCITSN